jgi:hypothetical protein
MITAVPFTESFNPIPSNVFTPPSAGTLLDEAFVGGLTPLMPDEYEVLDVLPIPDMRNWLRVYEPIGPEPVTCPILYEDIASGAEYCRCATCKHCFNAEALERATKTGGLDCPMCRSRWKSYTVYVNGLEQLQQDSQQKPLQRRISLWKRFKLLIGCFR